MNGEVTAARSGSGGNVGTSYPRVAGWLHCKGAARILNSESSNAHNRGRTYVQGVGPRLVAEQFAIYALRKCTHVRHDWQSLVIAEAHQVSYWVWRFQLEYRRLP